MNCPLCGSSDLKIEYKNVKDIEHRVAKGNFNYYKCNNCELIFIYPLPDINEVASFYDESYQCYSHPSKNKKNNFKEFIKKYFGFLFLDKIVEKNFQKIFKLLGKSIKDIKILEYGCGSCSTLLFLKKIFNLKDEQIMGVDLSRVAINICKQNGINAKCIYDIKEVNEKFDIIYSFQVLEHLLDPKDFINQSYDKLNAGGILYLQTPNSNGLARKIFKEFWKGNDIPRHIFIFNKKNLYKLLDDKFEILYFSTDRFYSSSFKLKKGLRLNEKHWTDKTLWNILLRLDFGRLLGLFGKGDNIHLILKKKHNWKVINE